MLKPRTALITAALACTALAPAAHAETRTTIAPLSAEGSVKTFGDLALVDVRDPSTKLWSLSLLQDGALTPVNVTPSPQPIDADIGSDSSGKPAIVLSVCSDPAKPNDPTAGSAPKTVGNCDLQILRPGVDAAPQPIANANSAGSEYAPTLWRGQLAFARSYGAKSAPVVYTKYLLTPRSRPSTRQPGVPTRRCSVQYKPGDCTTTGRGIEALELYGSHLAETVDYEVENQSGFETSEIRLVDTSKRSSALVALSTSGEGGQTYVGASFAPGYLSWNRSCFGDPGGCTGVSGGAFRYRYTTAGYEHANDPNQQLSGYAATPDGSLQVASDDSELDDDGAATLVRTGPLDWVTISGDRVK